MTPAAPGERGARLRIRVRLFAVQRELTRDPDLAGSVTVRFVIARDGRVSSSAVKRSSMGNAAVESCVASRILRFHFPEPRGGGVVIVSYPFIFSS